MMLRMCTLLFWIWVVFPVGGQATSVSGIKEDSIDICSQIEDKASLLDSKDCRGLKKVGEVQRKDYASIPEVQGVLNELVLMGKQQSPEGSCDFDEATFRDLGRLLDLCDRKRDCTGVTSICVKAKECHNVILEKQNRCHRVIPPYKNALEDAQKNCFLCKLACLFMGGAQTVLDRTEKELTHKALIILGLAFLFWIAITLLKLFATWGVGTDRNFIGALFIRSLVVGLVAIILSSGTDVVFRFGLNPLVDITTALSQKMVDAGRNAVADAKDSQVTWTRELATMIGMPGEKDFCPMCGNGSNFCASGSDRSIGLSPKSVNHIVCMVCRLSRSVTPYKVLGQQLLARAKLGDTPMEEAIELFGFQISIPKPIQAVLLGLAFLGAFMFIEFLIGFKIIHIIFNLMIVAVLMPFFVLFYAFPLTRQYTKKGWELFATTLFEIIGLALAILFTQILILGAISSPDVLEALGEKMQADIQNLDIDAIIDAMTKWDMTHVVLIILGLVLVASIVSTVIEDIAMLVRILTQVNFPETVSSAMSAASMGVRNTMRIVQELAKPSTPPPGGPPPAP